MSSAIPCSNSSKNAIGMIVLMGYRGKPPGSGDCSSIDHELLTVGHDTMSIITQNGMRKNSEPSRSTMA